MIIYFVTNDVIFNLNTVAWQYQHASTSGIQNVNNGIIDFQ